MKRYQCIKTYRGMKPGSHGTYIVPLFRQGHIYEWENVKDTDFIGVIDDFGTTHIVDEDLGSHFHELEDLHVDEIQTDYTDFNVDDHEEEQYTDMLPSEKSLGKGCAICVAAILTIVITLLSLL